MSGNSWPGGRRHAMTQAQHTEWNTAHYPGTRQLCWECNQPTGRCEEDSIIGPEGHPVCEECRGESTDPQPGDDA